MKLNAHNFSIESTLQSHHQNWFEVRVPGMLGENDFTLMAQSLALPTTGNEVVEVHYGNSHVNVAGKAQYEGGTINIHDSICAGTETQLRNWQALVYHEETGTVGWVNQYKKNVLVTLYGPEGVPFHYWDLCGAWPSTINWGNLDYTGADLRQIEITLTYDYCEDLGLTIAAPGIISNIAQSAVRGAVQGAVGAAISGAVGALGSLA